MEEEDLEVTMTVILYSDHYTTLVVVILGLCLLFFLMNQSRSST